jgi:hypothetical protein
MPSGRRNFGMAGLHRPLVGGTSALDITHPLQQEPQAKRRFGRILNIVGIDSLLIVSSGLFKAQGPLLAQLSKAVNG